MFFKKYLESAVVALQQLHIPHRLCQLKFKSSSAFFHRTHNQSNTVHVITLASSCTICELQLCTKPGEPGLTPLFMTYLWCGQTYLVATLACSMNFHIFCMQTVRRGTFFWPCMNGRIIPVFDSSPGLLNNTMSLLFQALGALITMCVCSAT